MIQGVLLAIMLGLGAVTVLAEEHYDPADEPLDLSGLIGLGTRLDERNSEAEYYFPTGEFLDTPSATAKRIQGDPDFEKLANLPHSSREYQLGRKVAHLRFRTSQGIGFCSGFLIGRDVLMTNHHCVVADGTSLPTSAFQVYMEYWHGNDPGPLSANVTDILKTSKPLDYAVLRLSTPLGERYQWLRLAEESAASGSVVVIQHPRGRSKEISRKNAGVVKRNQHTLHYLADTEGGSSGSPVFAAQGETVIALHHVGTLGYNEGVLMSVIVPEIRQWLPKPSTNPVPNARVPLKGERVDLRPILDLFDPQ